MATNFPNSADSFTNPTSGDTLDNPPHDQQHANINDAMEAVQASLLDGAPLHIDDANERVGVGTSSPQDVLHVVGDVTIGFDDDGSAAQPELTLHRESATPADGDYLGQVKFAGKNDVGQDVNYAKITGKISDVTDGTEDGLIEIANIKAGSQSIGYRFTSTDLKLLNGRGLEVDGDVGVGTTPSYKLDVDGDINTTGNVRIGGTAIGTWVSFTPNWNNLTIGNGTDQWRYAVVNDVLLIEGRTIMGTTTVVGTQPGFDLPNSFTLQNVGQPYGVVLYNDSGTGNYLGHVIPNGAGAIRFAELNVSGSLLKQENVTANSPFTWTAGDQLRASMTIRLT